MKKIIAAILVMVFCVVGICIVGPLCDPLLLTAWIFLTALL